MKEPRNNARLAVTIPSYANLVIHGLGCYLTVTFPIKEKIIPFLEFSNKYKWYTYNFSKNGKHYITATINISFIEIANRHCSINDVVYLYAEKMCRNLKVLNRKATIKAIEAELDCIAYEEN